MNKTKLFNQLTVGTKVRCIILFNEAVPSEHSMFERTVTLVNSTGVQFNTGSWLRKDDVKASDVTEVAAGSERAAVSIGWAVYQIENPYLAVLQGKRVTFSDDYYGFSLSSDGEYIHVQGAGSWAHRSDDKDAFYSDLARLVERHGDYKIVEARKF